MNDGFDGMTMKCPVCGKEFEYGPLNGFKVFCSDECEKKSKYGLVVVNRNGEVKVVECAKDADAFVETAKLVKGENLKTCALLTNFFGMTIFAIYDPTCADETNYKEQFNAVMTAKEGGCWFGDVVLATFSKVDGKEVGGFPLGFAEIIAEEFKAALAENKALPPEEFPKKNPDFDDDED